MNKLCSLIIALALAAVAESGCGASRAVDVAQPRAVVFGTVRSSQGVAVAAATVLARG